MALTFQPFVFTFSGGLNSKTDTFELTSPQLLQADNVRFQLEGGISKRSGFVALSKNILGGGQFAAGVACQVFDNELLAFDGTFIYSYVESVQAWVNRGLAISLINNQKKIINTRIAQQNNPDATNLNQQELFIWEDDRSSGGAGVRYSLLDTQTGAFIAFDQLLLSLATKPKCLAVPNTSTFNLYTCIGTSTLFLYTINTHTPNLISTHSTVLIDGLGVPGKTMAYDTTLYGNLPLIAYGGANGLQVNYAGNTSVITNGITQISSVAVMVTGSFLPRIWFAYATNTGLYVTVTDGSFTTVLAPIQITNLSTVVNIALIEDLTAGSANLTYEITNSPDNYIQNVIIKDNGTLTPVIQPDGNPGNSQTLRSVGLASKPFKFGNQIFVNTIYQSVNQSTYFTVCLTQGMKTISKLNPGVGGNYRSNGLLSECKALSTDAGQFLFANQKKGAFQTNDNISYSLLGVNASYLDFTNVNSFNSVVASNNLHIVGAVEKIYDGFSVVEDNFHLFSEISTGPGTSAGCLISLIAGGNLSTGQYQYVICYEWTDANNQVERGQPSIPVTITATAGQAAALTIPTLRITDKITPRSPVSIAVFRTILQNGVPSDIFYKITTDTAPLVNDVTADSVSFTDNTSDTEIAGNEPLYTASQIFNQAPPSCSLISAYQTRLFLSGLEDPNVIWTSQDRFQLTNYNTIPIEFSPLLIEGIDPTGGAITAIRALDQAMIVFKENNIFYFNGSGPNANATSGGFSDGVPIPSNSGCVNPNSIISIPANQFNSGGLMYQSNKGIYLIDRSYNNQYIGKNVQQYNNYHITSVEILEKENEVIFLTLEGTCLVYNYYFDRWSTWSYLPAVDSCIWNSNLTMIRSDGTVLTQQDGYYYDYSPHSINLNTGTSVNYKPVSRTLQIPWLAFAGLQGFQSVPSAILLGHYLSPHIINISVMYDYDPAPKEPISINSNIVSNVWGGLTTFGAGINFGGGQFTPYEFQYNIGYPWCKAISLLITDNPLTSDDQGSIWSALTFQVGIFQDPVRLPAQNKFSGNKVPNGRYQ